MKRVVVVASASGNGKTTLGRELARRLDVPFVEMDALVHGPNWTETADGVLRAQIEPVIATNGWVIDGAYRRKLGDLVLEHADTVVWLDLPLRVWLFRAHPPHLAAASPPGRALEREHGVVSERRLGS